MEENAVALVADLGKIADGGRYRGTRGTGEAAAIRVLRGNLKRRPVFNELTAEAVLSIVDFEAPPDAAPLDGGAHGRVGRSARYQSAIRQAVGQVDPVEHGHIVELERGSALAKVRDDIVGGNHTRLSNPEQAIRREGVNPGIIRVNFGRARRARGKDQSDEGESSLVDLPVHPDVHPLCELEIGDGYGEAVTVAICPAPATYSDPDVADEIGDVSPVGSLVGKAKGFMYGKGGDARAKQIRGKRTGDGLRQDAVIVGPRPDRRQESGAKEAAGCTGRGTQKVASG
jgi:hypothetical protein